MFQQDRHPPPLDIGLNNSATSLVKKREASASPSCLAPLISCAERLSPSHTQTGQHDHGGGGADLLHSTDLLPNARFPARTPPRVAMARWRLGEDKPQAALPGASLTLIVRSRGSAASPKPRRMCLREKSR